MKLSTYIRIILTVVVITGIMTSAYAQQKAFKLKKKTKAVNVIKPQAIPDGTKDATGNIKP